MWMCKFQQEDVEWHLHTDAAGASTEARRQGAYVEWTGCEEGGSDQGETEVKSQYTNHKSQTNQRKQ